MKIVLSSLLGFVVLLFATSCEKTVLKPEGVMSEQVIDTLSFSSIDLKGDFDVELYPSNKNVVKIQAAESLFGNLSVNLSGEELQVEQLEKVEAKKPYKVSVHFKALDKIILKEKVKAIVHGEIKQKVLDIELSEEAFLEGKLDTKRLILDLQENASAKLEGKSHEADFVITENVVVKAYDLDLKELRFNISDNAEIEVSVQRKIKGTASQNSTLNYRGAPETKISTKENAEIIAN